MTEQQITEFINRINSNTHQNTIFLRPLSEKVDLAKVWESEPEIDDSLSTNLPSYKFFFIKNELQKYVGAVLDMDNDLHAVVLKEERKKGHLSKAMIETILPFIFYDDRNYQRDVQRITIDEGINYENSKRVALRLGFEPVDKEESVFELKEVNFDWSNENLNERNRSIADHRISELRRRMVFAYKNLKKISDELLMAFDDDKGLDELAEPLRYFEFKIKDLAIDQKRREEK